MSYNSMGIDITNFKATPEDKQNKEYNHSGISICVPTLEAT